MKIALKVNSEDVGFWSEVKSELDWMGGGYPGLFLFIVFVAGFYIIIFLYSTIMSCICDNKYIYIYM